MIRFLENKGFFFDVLHENLRRTMEPKILEFTALSVHLGPQTLKFTACSVQGKTNSRNQPHYQRYVQGADAHESKPSE